MIFNSIYDELLNSVNVVLILIGMTITSKNIQIIQILDEVYHVW